MPIPVNCGCGASYNLKDEYAGQVLRCPQCGAAIQVGQPVAPAAPAAPAPQADSIFACDKFLLRQKALAISEKYDVCDEQGQALLFVQRPRYVAWNLLALVAGVVAGFLWFFVVGGMAAAFLTGAAAWIAGLFAILGFFAVMIAVIVAIEPKRHVTFYRDDSRTEKLLEVIQDRKWQIPNATYTVRDAVGRVLARLRKNYVYNVFRKRWYCDAPDGRPLCVAKEDSVLLSLLRRLLGPLFGLLRTNFVILRDGQIIGEFNRKFTILDRYVLDFSADPVRTIDRRVALALGVMLDTGERR